MAKTFVVSASDETYRAHRMASKAQIGEFDVFHIYVSASDFVNNLAGVPEDINPRRHLFDSSLVTKGAVAKEVADSLENYADHFGVLNRGVTIVARSVEREGSRVIIDVPDPDRYGLIDGGTTRAITLDYYRRYIDTPQPVDTDQFEEWKERREDWKHTSIHIEVLVPVSAKCLDDLLVTLAAARNTSRQVRQIDLFDHQGAFSRLQSWLRGAGSVKNPELKPIMMDHISFAEGSVSDKDDVIDVKQLIPLIGVFLPKFRYDGEGSAQNPTGLYCASLEEVKNFAEEEINDLKNKTSNSEYYPLRNIVVDVCNLYEYVYVNMEQWYAAGAARKAKSQPNQRLKIAAGKPLIRVPDDSLISLPLTGRTSDFKFPRAFVFPFFFGLTTLLEHDPNGNKASHWVMDPFAFLAKHGPALMVWYYDTVIMKNDVAPAENRMTKISVAAKDASKYELIYNKFELQYSKFELQVLKSR